MDASALREKNRRRALRAATSALTLVIAGCAAPPKAATPTATAPPAAETPVLWTVHAARHEDVFIKLNLPVVASGMRIDIGLPASPASSPPSPSSPPAWVDDGHAVTLYSCRILRGAVTGPAVDQLTGYPAAASDAGSFLVPLKSEPAAKGSHRFTIREPMPVYARVEVSALQEPGTYQFPVTITLPGKASETVALNLVVSPVALPAQPRVLAVATTTAATLSRLFPDAFGTINGRHLDRGDPAQHAAVARLDALVRAAKKAGVAFFVEDLGPEIKVDEVGRVLLNWDAYDRVMQPYMDGSAFLDRLPLAAWLAPTPPKRISDSPTQLRQYMAACAQHFSNKGWTAAPAFLHEALVTPDSPRNAARRDEVSKLLRLHMTRDMLAVTTPDADVPQPRLWVVDDTDPRLPPAGALATEKTLRVWPWMCAARSAPDAGNVKGFVWRDALESAAQLETNLAAGAATTTESARPLFVTMTAEPHAPADTPLTVVPSLRMLWLEEGLQDVAMVGLLEQRSDPAVVQELFAGIVGRTGLTGKAAAVAADAPPGKMPLASPGYLYAGWPEDPSTWAAVPAMLEKLVLANNPGAGAVGGGEKVSGDDPLYMATKLWLANARRPVARVAGYAMNLHAGEVGDILDCTVNLLAENPVNGTVEMQARCSLLPGDLDLARATALDADAGRRGGEGRRGGRKWRCRRMASRGSNCRSSAMSICSITSRPQLPRSR